MDKERNFTAKSKKTTIACDLFRLYNKYWGNQVEPTKKFEQKKKKVEHIWRKSVIMGLSRNQERRSNMLYTHFTEKLLGLQGVNIKNIEENESNRIVYLELERKDHHCPCCGAATRTVMDYRPQKVKDIPAFGKNTILMLRKRRYRCPNCGKRFQEDNPFLPRYHRMTSRLAAFVINNLANERSFTSVAGEVNLSVSTVIRIFECGHH